MTDRKIIEFLPEYLQNEQLRKFFNATVDHWFKKEQSKKLSGFVGRVPSYFDADKDFYQVEPTSERQFYQLEPTMVSFTDDGEINQSLVYPDLVNHLRFQGANIDNESRLFEQDYYSWSPPINVDMFVNYSNYFWYPEGPTAITIKGNASITVDVDNDIIGVTSYTSPNAIPFSNGMKVTFGSNVIPASYVGNTYIVEGVGEGIILVDFDQLDPSQYPIEYDNNDEKEYITIGRGAQNENPWSRTNHWYHKDILTFNLSQDQALFIEEESAVLWDASGWDSEPWDSVITELVPTINLSQLRQARRPIIEFQRDIELYNYGYLSPRIVDLVDDEHNDVFSQIQGQPTTTSIQVDGVSLTNGKTVLVINDNNTSVNNRIYEVNFLEVSPGNYEYQLILQTDGVNIDGSPALNEKILVRSGSSIGLEYFYDGINYSLAQRKLTSNQAPLFKLYDNEGNYLGDENIFSDSTFAGNSIFTYKVDTSSDAIIDSELGFGVFYKNFNQISEIVFDHTLSSDRYTYELDNEREEIKGFYYFHRIASTGVSDYYGNSWNVKPSVSTQDLQNGFYTVPDNLQGNPLHDVVTETTRSELLAHFNSIISNQIGITGTVPTDTNFRNLAEDLGLGDKILQHTSPLLRTMMLSSNEDLDYMKSIRYSQREYKRFYNKFVKKIKSFIDQGLEETTTKNSRWLEDAISQINVSKKSTDFPFSYNRTLPSSLNYESVEYAAVLGETIFVAPQVYDDSSTSTTATLLVYVDDELQLIDYDYTISSGNVEFNNSMSGGETVEIRYYENVDRSFIPSTAAMMGLTPVYKPEKLIDNTYVAPRSVIQGHDGSLIQAYGDKRDEVILEFEKRIYNTIRSKFRGDRTIYFDINEVKPGKFRDVGYTLDEFNSVLSPIFTTWATSAGVDWVTNSTVDLTEWKTWNFTGLLDTKDSEPLQGSWRAVFDYWYDTDRPHTHPWEMLGFSEKPDWWETEYGTEPYTSLNTTMWTDLESGTIKQGTRAGTHTLYARPGLSNYIPVNNGGDLLDPVTIGIVDQNPNDIQKAENWSVGDRSPVETAFFRSPEASFIWSQLVYLLKPAKWVEIGWDSEAIEYSIINENQLINSRTNDRPKYSELFVAGELDDNNNLVRRQGVQQWVTNYLEFLNKDIKSNFGDILRGLDVRLGWKAAGFVKTETIRFLADAYSPSSTSSTQKVFIQNEDIDIELYESPSTKESMYSGVIVEWSGSGWQVFGYDSLYPFFRTIPSSTKSKKVSITVGDVTVTEQTQGDFGTIQEIPYGYEFETRQEVYNFLISYGRWLETEGWVFDEYDNSINEIYNWRYAGKEFLFWTLDNLEIGSFIALSPFANKAKFNQEVGLIDNVEEFIQGTYSLLDRSGQPIKPENVITVREDNELVVKPDGAQGIYGLRVSVRTYEHIVLFSNITRFNDSIYIPLFNLRQQRLKAIGMITDGWNGRVDVPGFILDFATAGDLVPNFEKLANDFRRYHSIESPSDNDTITDTARHLIGYQEREYLDGLLIDRDTQYQFYQGFIREKGSRNALNRIFRSDGIISDESVKFLEEWAFRVGEYGGTESLTTYEFEVQSSDVKIDPQLFRFRSGKQADTPYDNIIDILPNDERWRVKPTVGIANFSLREKNTYYKRDLPNAGYALLGDTNYLAVTPTELFDPNESVFNASLGDTVWVAKDENYLIRKSWDIRRLVDSQSAHTWYSDPDDNNILTSYIEDTFTGNGVNRTYNLSTNIDLDVTNPDIYVYLDGIRDTSFEITDVKQVTFDTAPSLGTSIVIHSLDQHSWTNNNALIVFENQDGTRQAGPISSIGTSTITVDENVVVFEEIFEDANFYFWESKRFDGGTDPNIILTPSEYTNELVYFDQSADNDGWAVYKSNGSVFRIERNEEKLVDSDHIKNSLIYNDETNRIESRASLYDPFKGYIPGIADVEITWKLEYDPAKYTNGSASSYNEDLAWGEHQLGRVWWDLSQVRFLWYEQDDLEYRYQNWGKLFPGTSIDVYEWVRSPVPPADWENYVSTSSSNFSFEESGTVKDIDTDDGPNWVEREERDTDGEIRTFYYFWVTNKTTTPNLPFRSISIDEVASIISDPLFNGVNYISAIESRSFILANTLTNVSDSNSILQINFDSSCCEVPIHKQWVLLRENDTFSPIPDRLWNKMRDSLVGFDDLDKEVPAFGLSGKSKYGNLYRPRQTWFEDKLLARKVFVRAINDILKNVDIVGTISDYDTYLNTKDSITITSNIVEGTTSNPSVTPGSVLNINGELITLSGLGGFEDTVDEINTGLTNINVTAEIFYVGNDAYLRLRDDVFGQDINIIDVSGTPSSELGLTTGNHNGTGPDYIVSSRLERDALSGLNSGDKVYVESDENLLGYWTYWRYNGTNDWFLLQIQDFNTNNFWNYIDWYKSGYDSTVNIDLTVDTIADRNTYSASDGEIIKVLNDGSNKWALYLYENDSWTTIGKEDATIEFSDLLYDSVKAGYGFDDSLFDTKPFDDVPNKEFKEIMKALRENILVESNLIYQNVLFFKMVRHVHTEQELVDWCFKTSYIFIIGFTEALEQKPLYTNDGFESIINYVNEAKPYHTKIKDIIRTFANITDSANISVTDYDKPSYDDPDLGLRILDENVSTDYAYMSSNEPWSDWLNEYSKDLRPTVSRVNNVRKIYDRVVFDRKSAIRDDWVPSINYSLLSSQQIATDSTSSPINGTIIGASFVKGLLGNSALSFNGSSYVNIGSNTDVDVTGSFTVEALIKVSDTQQSTLSNGDSRIVSRDDETNGWGFTFAGPVGDGALRFFIRQPSTTILDTATGVIQPNTVHHVAAVYDNAGQTMTIYVDGVQKAQTTGVIKTPTAPTASLRIGSNLVNGWFKGIIDDVRFWKTAKTPAELLANKDTELAGSEANLIGYWKFNEGIVDVHPFIFSNETSNTSVLLDNPEWKLLDEYDGTVAPTDNLATIRYKPRNREIYITGSGTWTNGSTITVEAGDENDFTGTNVTIATFTKDDIVTIDFDDVRDYPFIRANTSAYTSGDTISITLMATYDNTLYRALEDYEPTVDMPNLLEVITSEYQGNVIDGFTATLQEGYDVSPWDFTGWDPDTTAIESVLDNKISGGAFFTYEGDGTTGSFDLPVSTIAVEPWQIYISDTTLSTPVPMLMEEGTHYTVVGDKVILLSDASFIWETSGNLDVGWALVILDSTFTSNDAYHIIIEGNNFVQPDVEGWPEEIVMLKMNDSANITVVTSGNIEFTLISSATSTVDGDVYTFGGVEPLTFTFSGISGDTVVLEGSATGAFSGEETTIETVTSNTLITIPSVSLGYSSFQYYRARVTVYGSGTITVVGTVTNMPTTLQTAYTSNGVDVTYNIGQNVEQTDDVLVTIDGELTTNFTVNTSLDQITFGAAPSADSEIIITSFDTVGASSDPVFYTDTYLGSALDLANFGGAAQDVQSGPTEPLESGLLVFADDNGSGEFRRLLPPEGNYYTGNGTMTDFILLYGQYGLTQSNVSIWNQDVAQTDGTDYYFIQGGFEQPQLTVSTAGSGYTIGDTLAINGGTPSRNLLNMTEEFDVSWTISNSTISSNATIAPNGKVTADKLVENATNTPHNISQNSSATIGESITHSIYAKSAERNEFDFLIYDGSGYHGKLVNLSTGTLSLPLSGGVTNAATANITNVGSGWYRISITVTQISTTTTQTQMRLSNGSATTYLGDGTSGIYLWGAQMEEQMYVTPYVATETKIQVIEVAPIDAQDETVYNGVGSNGTFSGGTGHAVSDVLTMSDGTTITVDAVSSGVITQFTVSSSTSNGLNSNGATINQISSTSTGIGFSLTLGSNNEGVHTLKTTNKGLYSVVPSTPNTPDNISVTGTGLTVDLSAYSTVEDMIRFITAPGNEERIAIQVLGNHEYSISGTNINFTNLTSGDVVGIMSFETDEAMSLQTLSFTGDIPTLFPVTDNKYRIPIKHKPTGEDYIFLTYRFLESNLLLYSEELDNAAWTKNNTTVLADTITSPNGTVTVDKLIEDGTNNQHTCSQSVSASASTVYTVSAYFKEAERYKGGFRISDSNGFITRVIINFNTGAVEDAGSASVILTPLGNDFYRASATFTTTVGATSVQAEPQIIHETSGVTYLGDGTSGLYVWGLQLEEESKVGKYVQTTSATISKPDHTEQTTETISLNTESGGWDTTGFDTSYSSFDADEGSMIEVPYTYNTDELIITSFAGEPIFDTLTYREFYGYDKTPLDIVRRFNRFSDSYKTTLTTAVQPTDNVIEVDDASIFASSNGAVWVNGELVNYLTRTGGTTSGTPGTLVGLARGSKGTPKSKVHAAGSVVRPASNDDSTTHAIPQMENQMINDPGKRLQASSTSGASFLQSSPGGYKTYT